MKKNNKGIILLEATIGMGVILICLFFLATLIRETHNQQEQSIEIVATQNIKKIINQVDYLKRAMIERGTTTEFAKQNLIYAGWDELSITPDGQTIDDLNGTFIIDTSCALGWVDWLCLRQVLWNEWGYLRLTAETQLLNEDNGTITSSFDTSSQEQCDELNPDCQAYRINISSASWGKYDPLFYNQSDGTSREIDPGKTLSILIKNTENEGEDLEFNYLLSIY